MLALALIAFSIPIGGWVQDPPDLTSEPETVQVHVNTIASNFAVVASTNPSPEAVFALVTNNIKPGDDLTCTVADGMFFCEGGTVLSFTGCIAPEAVAQPPVQHASRDSKKDRS